MFGEAGGTKLLRSLNTGLGGLEYIPKLLQHHGWKGQAQFNASEKELCGGQIEGRKRFELGQHYCNPDKNNESLSRGYGSD